ncbi:MAG TPA: adenylate/guanylate cyclase domain-containing protein [Acidimicrobiia bacterium]|nr:adenylate/guanylate cyclase domain-containing protein [Acidimicrobiia bacterium]
MTAGSGGILLPTGTLTFLFTDVERSTDLLSRVGDVEFAEVLASHSVGIRDAIAAHGGVEVSTEGDSHFAVFPDAAQAVRAAVRIQQTGNVIAAGETVRVRVGLHTGSAVLGGDNYVGVDVHKASRIADSGHGGQVLVSDTTSGLVQSQLLNGTTTHSVGRYRLAGFSDPVEIFQVDFPGMDEKFPPLRVRPVESRLPSPLTEFIGRQEEIARGVQILETSRLLTLTGPGGTGKTRLSLEIARSVEPEFRDGAHMVPLAAISDPDTIPMTILEALQLTIAGGVEPQEHLHRFLAERQILLLLDNFEQLVEGAALLTEILASAPLLKLIVTSRSPLRIAGERELPVPPLEVPPAGQPLAVVAAAEGVKMFVNRAQAVRPDFTLDEDNAGTVAEIARSLDGLPLAIELAASRLRTFTPEVVLDRLNNQLLSGHTPGLPKRQQTIVNTIGWSYDLLDEPNRRLFEQLSIFSGAFGLPAAEEICDGDVFDGLAELVDQSLLRQAEIAGDPRFRMLTVIKEFGYAALVARGDEREVADRHAAAYLRMAEQASEEIMTSKQAEWLARLTEDHDNLSAAMDHLIRSGDAEAAQGMAGSLWRFWQIRGYIHEGIQRIEESLALRDDTDPLNRARALTGLGGLLYWKGAVDRAEAPYREALDLYRAHGSDRDIADALYNLGFAIAYSGKVEEAVAVFEQSREMAEKAGWRLGIGHANWALAMTATFLGRWEDGVEGSEAALEQYQGEDVPFDMGWARFMKSHSLKGAGRAEEARAALVPAIEGFYEVRDYSALALVLTLAAALVIDSVDRSGGSYILGGADRIKMETGVEIADTTMSQYPEVMGIRSVMSSPEKASYELGRMAPLEDVMTRTFEFLSGSISDNTPTPG